MSQLSFAVTHNEYTGSPTSETKLDYPQSFNPFTAIKEGFSAAYKKGNKTVTWIVFTFIGLLLSAGFMAGSSIVASAANESNPGSFPSILGNALSFIAILAAAYFFFGLTQGYIRGTHFQAPKYDDLLVKTPKTVIRSYGATISLGLIAILLILPLSALNLITVVVGIPVPKSVNLGITVLVVVMFVLLRVFFAYTIYAIIDSNMKVLDAFILSLKVVSHNFVSSLALFIITTLLLVAPAGLIAYLPMSMMNDASNGVLVTLWVVAGLITLLVFPATQSAYVYAYRKSTLGPVPAGGCVTQPDVDVIKEERVSGANEDSVAETEETPVKAEEDSTEGEKEDGTSAGDEQDADSPQISSEEDDEKQ